MTVIVRLPALSPTMEEGKIAKWIKQEGDSIKEGDVLAEIETDKATMEVESAHEGTLGKILLKAGDTGKVAQSMAIIMQDGDTPADLEKALATAALAYGATAAAPPPVATDSPLPAPVPAAAVSSGMPIAPTGRVFATPLARRIAADRGIALHTLQGTGPHGRITKHDVDASGTPSAVAPHAKSLGDSTATGVAPFTDMPHSSMRKTIAKRLLESKQTIPHFYVAMDYDVGALLAARHEMNNLSQDLYKISVNDFIIKAAAMALRDVPEVNAYWSADSMRMFHRSDVAVAVATPTGLFTPIVRGADSKGIVAISHEMKALIKKTLEGKLKPDDYMGGGFSISNMGMYGVNQFTPIVNPPQSAILGVGATLERAVVKNGAIVIGHVMTLTLAADHRVVDGAKAAEFMNALKRYLEHPLLLAL